MIMPVLTVVIYAVVIVAVVLGLVSLGYGAHLAGPFVSTSPAERIAIAAALPVDDQSVVYDLGCGDGAVLFALLDRRPGLRAVGVDVAWPPLLVAWLKRRLFRRYRNLRLVWGDYFRMDIGDADAVTVYALRKAYPKLTKKFGTELRDGAWVAVERWPFAGLMPVKTVRTPGGHDWYLYRAGQFRSGA